MAAEDADDRAHFYYTDEFGVSGSYTRQGSAPVTIAGIFDREPLSISLGAELSLDDADPQFEVHESDLPAGAGIGDALVIGSENWTVKNIKPDGTGMAIIKLEKL